MGSEFEKATAASFATHAPTPRSALAKAWPRVLLAIFFAALTLSLGYGVRGLNEPDEGRYAEQAREMLESLETDRAAWLEITLDGQPYYSKPPLVHWCIMASMKLFGLNEWGARLPSVLAAFATVLVAVALTWRMGGECAWRWPVLTAFILPTSGMFFVLGRLITTDMLLSFFITLALTAFWHWMEGSGRWALLVFWLGLAGGMMSKGPVAVALPVLVVGATLAWSRQPRKMLYLGWSWGLPLFGLLGLWWYLQAAMRFDLWGFFLGEQVAGHYFTTAQGHDKPWWYMTAVLLIGAMPWTLSALAGARRLSPEETSLETRQRRFLIAWVIAPLAFFSLSHSKLPTYILPALVPVALLAGRFWNAWLSQPGRQGRDKLAALAVGSAVVCVALLPLGYWLWLWRYDGVRPRLHGGHFLTALVALVVLLGMCWWMRRQPARNFVVLVAATAIFLVASTIDVKRFEDAIGPQASFRSLGTELRALARPEDRVALVLSKERGHGLNFYSRRLISKKRLGESPEGMQHPPEDLLLQGVDQIWDWSRQGHRVFCVVPTDKCQAFQEAAPVPVSQLYLTPRRTLFLVSPSK